MKLQLSPQDRKLSGRVGRKSPVEAMPGSNRGSPLSICFVGADGLLGGPSQGADDFFELELAYITSGTRLMMGLL